VFLNDDFELSHHFSSVNFLTMAANLGICKVLRNTFLCR
jgi:hypothetical protein